VWSETKVLPPVFTLENLAGWSSRRNWKSVVKRETLLLKELRPKKKPESWGLGISCGRRGGSEQPPGIPGNLSDGEPAAGGGGLRVSEEGWPRDT